MTREFCVRVRQGLSGDHLEGSAFGHVVGEDGHQEDLTGEETEGVGRLVREELLTQTAEIVVDLNLADAVGGFCRSHHPTLLAGRIATDGGAHR